MARVLAHMRGTGLRNRIYMEDQLVQEGVQRFVTILPKKGLEMRS